MLVSHIDIPKEIVDACKDVTLAKDEHVLMCVLCPESQALEYPFVTKDYGEGEKRDVYEIPDDKRYDELKKCWVFDEDIFDADETVNDLHSNESFKFCDAQIIRFAGRNMIVTPKYLEYGGMLCDIMRPLESVCVMKTRPVDKEEQKQ